MKLNLLFLTLLSIPLVVVCPVGHGAERFKITDYGAVGDGETVNTFAVQETIDACHANGGGTVWVPAGGEDKTSGLDS